jgi:peptidoglycan hydrolase-like protein with peptidoglycan-binding domain
VLALQAALHITPLSGWFGPVTQQAVRTLQQTKGLPVTGIVDAATWRALGR